jgi:hypothetical protein
VKQRSQQIGAAISVDLYAWNKYEGNPVIRPDPSWSNWQPSGDQSCRDAHILEIEPGQFVWENGVISVFSRSVAKAWYLRSPWFEFVPI